MQDDIATNTSAVDGRLCLAPVMSKKELRKGFAISAAVPFVKAGTLKVRERGWHRTAPYVPAPYLVAQYGTEYFSYLVVQFACAVRL